MSIVRCFAFFSLLTLFIAPTRAAEIIPKAEVDALVAPAIDGQWLQSVAIGIIDEHGTQTLGYGTLSPTDNKPPTANTVYEIGSITKTFTGTLLAQMVEAKELSLDEPVQKLLPPTVKVPRTKASPITLLHLATHRSGLPSLPTNFTPADPGNPYADYSVQQMYDFISSYELPRDPGAVASYSNLGMGLLGHALSLHAGKTYEQLLIERICQPLKLDSTRITLNAGLGARLAPGFNADGGPEKNWDLPTLAGAGAIRSTINDMLKYVSAEAGLTHTPFDAALKLSQTRQAQFDAHNDIGLNWLIEKETGVQWHNGQTGGYHTFAGFDPNRHVGVIVLSNTGSGLVDAIGFSLMHRMLGEPIRPLKLRKSIHLDPTTLDRYVGQYKLGLLSTLTIRRDKDHLTAQLTGQVAARIYPESDKKFFWKIAPAEVTFDITDTGEVTGLTIHQNGRDLPAKKVK